MDFYQDGCIMLVHGASGGVGSAATQIAVSRGITVYGTAGSQEGLDYVMQLGASRVFNHTEADYVEKITPPVVEAPDVIIELKMSKNLENDLRMINQRGLILALGDRSPTQINPVWFMSKQCHVAGMALYQSTEEEWVQTHDWVASGLHDGWLRPRICKEYKLSDVSEAHSDLTNSTGTTGKRVLVM